MFHLIIEYKVDFSFGISNSPHASAAVVVVVIIVVVVVVYPKSYQTAWRL